MACSSENKTTSSDSMSMDTTMSDTSGLDENDSMTGTTTKVDEEAGNFMKMAAVGGMMEVEAGKLAQTNGSSQAVKDFGAKMVADHTAAGNELMALASNNQVMIPTSLPPAEQKHVDEMKKMSGKAFDAHYMGMMVNDHAKTVGMFRDATRSKHADVRAFAEKTLPTLEGHHTEAKKIKSSM
ncbi:MAG: DUF4142 domain-containing protein [Chitinophagaceae bacterium]|nr:MAG: DUF4142 domain-containing protein [Chitinophagaceae bacterium]